MEHHQGKLLRALLEKHFPELSIEKIASLLSMTRQNLNHHLRKDLLEEGFVRLLKEKLLFVSLEHGFSKTNSANEPEEPYGTQIQIIDEKDLHPIMRKYIRELEESNQVLKRVISLQDEKIERLENH